MSEQCKQNIKQLSKLESKVKRNHYTVELLRLLNYDEEDNHALLLDILYSLKGCDMKAK